MIEELKGYDGCFDLLTAFELFEHLYNPRDLIKVVYRLLKPDGKFLLTTLNGQGFDIQVLWEKSKSVSPPHHLNFFNPASLSLLLGSEGFVIQDLATPGELDWSIVEGMILDERVNAGHFWNSLARRDDLSQAKNELQEWISRNGLSSHMRVLAIKK